jgi:hypothetical protein
MVKTDANSDEECPYGLYGNNFGRADEETVSQATVTLEQPTVTNSIAMGPPVTMMAGMSSLAAAMSMPGKILSQGLAFGLHLESDDWFVGFR